MQVNTMTTTIQKQNFRIIYNWVVGRCFFFVFFFRHTMYCAWSWYSVQTFFIIIILYIARCRILCANFCRMGFAICCVHNKLIPAAWFRCWFWMEAENCAFRCDAMLAPGISLSSAVIRHSVYHHPFFSSTHLVLQWASFYRREN